MKDCKTIKTLTSIGNSENQNLNMKKFLY